MRTTYPQARYWLLTIPVADWAVPSELPLAITWLRGQQERGSDGGYEHWQLFAAFRKKTRLSTVKSYFANTAHAEPSRSEAAEGYVFKEDTAIAGTRFELGQKIFNRSLPKDWERIRELAKSGRADEIDAETFMKLYPTIRRIEKDYMVKPNDLDDVCGVWIWGPAGVGKSRKARIDYPEAYDKTCNKWWDGYRNQDNVLIDDLDLNHSVLGHHLKIWADRYAFIAENKGGAINIRPKKIVVTSNYPIERIFEEQALQDAIKRRFIVINLTF